MAFEEEIRAAGLPKTAQTGIRNSKTSFNNFSYFLGGIDVTSQNIDQFTPYIKGVSRIFLHKPPTFMNMKGMYEEETTRFKQYLETGYTSIDGINDVSVSFTDFEGGFAGQKFSNVSLAQDDTDSLTIRVYELAGSPVREYIDTWVTGVRDIRSGIAHYHGLIQRGELSYKEGHHTAEFIYTTMDPTGLLCEYVAMFAHAFPRKVPKNHLNFEKGDRENVLMDLEFHVTKYESPAINSIGNWYLQNSLVDYNYLDFDPTIGDNAVSNYSTYDYGAGGAMHEHR